MNAKTHKPARPINAAKTISRAAVAAIEPLEQRQLMSATLYDSGPFAGTLAINGGEANDTFKLMYGTTSKGHSAIRVIENGNTIGLYPSYDVTNIVASLGGGNDTFDATALSRTMTVYGNGGNDTFKAGTGHSTFFGGDGNDTATGQGGNDTLIGNGGNDPLVGGDGADTFNGGAGFDTVDYRTADGRVNVTLDGKPNDGRANGKDGPGGTDNVKADVERVYGTAFNDSLVGNSAANALHGEGGVDTIDGQGGNDTLYGGAGDDTLVGGTGDDKLFGGGDVDQLVGGPGFDRFLNNAVRVGNGLLRQDTSDKSGGDIDFDFYDSGEMEDVTIPAISTYHPLSFAAGRWDDNRIRMIDESLSVVHRELQSASIFSPYLASVSINRLGAHTEGTRTAPAFTIGDQIYFTNDAFAGGNVTDTVRRNTLHQIGLRVFKTESEGWADRAGWLYLGFNTNVVSDTPYESVSDGWWVRKDSVFVSERAERSPSADFAETFAARAYEAAGWSGFSDSPIKDGYMDTLFYDFRG